METKSINPGRGKPKAISLRAEVDEARCPPPPRENPWRGVELGKVLIISWC